MAARPMIVNEVLCYISCVRNTFTITKIKEAVINLFNQQALQEAFHLYPELCALVNKPSGASTGASVLKY